MIASDMVLSVESLKGRYLATRLFIYIPLFKAWSFIPYMKCSFRCIYCSVDVQGLSRPTVEPEDFLSTLDEELNYIIDLSKRLGAPFQIYASALTDCYVPQEKEYNYTRMFLQQMVDRSLTYQVITKGGLLLERDMDLFSASKNCLSVSVCLTASTNEKLKSIEPGAPGLDERLHCIEKLNSAGVTVIANVSPWIPGVTDVEAIVKLLPDNVRLCVGPLEYQELLDQNFFSPQHINDKYTALRHGPLSEKLLSFFQRGTCKSTKAVYGKMWSQQDINSAYIKERDRLSALKNIFWSQPPEWQGDTAMDYCMKELKL